MTKDVLIAIKGLQFEEAEDAEEIEVIQRGQYFQRNVTALIFLLQFHQTTLYLSF